MTKEQAIEVLHELDGRIYETQQVALDMAIKALEQNEVLQKENEDFRNYIDKANHTNSQLIQLIEKHKMNRDTCDDCVSRAEVIDELNRLGRNVFKDDTDYDNFFAFVDSLSPVTPTQRWIPVSERLPKERGIYIVTEKVFSIGDREHKGRYNTKVEQVEYCNGKWQRANFFEVIAWQPLPQPYEEKRGSENEENI